MHGSRGGCIIINKKVIVHGHNVYYGLRSESLYCDCIDLGESYRIAVRWR